LIDEEENIRIYPVYVDCRGKAISVEKIRKNNSLWNIGGFLNNLLFYNYLAYLFKKLSYA
jgi:hypothetical protein